MSLDVRLVGDLGVDREDDEVGGSGQVLEAAGVQSFRHAREELEARAVVVGHPPFLLEQQCGLGVGLVAFIR